MDVKWVCWNTLLCLHMLLGYVFSQGSRLPSGASERRHACWGSFGPPVVSGQCPRGTIMQVVRAGLKVHGRGGRCIFREKDCGCEFGEKGCIMPDVQELCQGRSACRLDVTQQYISTLKCQGFSDYMYIEFNCVKGQESRIEGPDTDICSDSATLQNQGFIHSPNYPSSYPINQRCQCTLTTKPFASIVMSILDFHVNDYRCKHDTLRLMYGGRATRLCGHSNGISNNFYSNSNLVQMIFNTDSKGTAEGFWIKYMAKPAAPVRVECSSAVRFPSSHEIIGARPQPQPHYKQTSNLVASHRKASLEWDRFKTANNHHGDPSPNIIPISHEEIEDDIPIQRLAKYDRREVQTGDPTKEPQSLEATLGSLEELTKLASLLKLVESLETFDELDNVKGTDEDSKLIRDNIELAKPKNNTMIVNQPLQKVSPKRTNFLNEMFDSKQLPKKQENYLNEMIDSDKAPKKQRNYLNEMFNTNRVPKKQITYLNERFNSNNGQTPTYYANDDDQYDIYDYMNIYEMVKDNWLQNELQTSQTPTETTTTIATTQVPTTVQNPTKKRVIKKKLVKKIRNTNMGDTSGRSFRRDSFIKPTNVTAKAEPPTKQQKFEKTIEIEETTRPWWWKFAVHTTETPALSTPRFTTPSPIPAKINDDSKANDNEFRHDYSYNDLETILKRDNQIDYPLDDYSHEINENILEDDMNIAFSGADDRNQFPLHQQPFAKHRLPQHVAPRASSFNPALQGKSLLNTPKHDNSPPQSPPKALSGLTLQQRRKLRLIKAQIEMIKKRLAAKTSGEAKSEDDIGIQDNNDISSKVPGVYTNRFIGKVANPEEMPINSQSNILSPMVKPVDPVRYQDMLGKLQGIVASEDPEQKFQVFEKSKFVNPPGSTDINPYLYPNEPQAPPFLSSNFGYRPTLEEDMDPFEQNPYLFPPGNAGNDVNSQLHHPRIYNPPDTLNLYNTRDEPRNAYDTLERSSNMYNNKGESPSTSGNTDRSALEMSLSERISKLLNNKMENKDEVEGEASIEYNYNASKNSNKKKKGDEREDIEKSDKKTKVKKIKVSRRKKTKSDEENDDGDDDDENGMTKGKDTMGDIRSRKKYKKGDDDDDKEDQRIRPRNRDRPSRNDVKDNRENSYRNQSERRPSERRSSTSKDEDDPNDFIKRMRTLYKGAFDDASYKSAKPTDRSRIGQAKTHPHYSKASNHPNSQARPSVTPSGRTGRFDHPNTDVVHHQTTTPYNERNHMGSHQRVGENVGESRGQLIKAGSSSSPTENHAHHEEEGPSDWTVTIVAIGVVAVIIIVIVAGIIIRHFMNKKERENAIRQRHKRECAMRKTMQERHGGGSRQQATPVKR